MIYRYFFVMEGNKQSCDVIIRKVPLAIASRPKIIINRVTMAAGPRRSTRTVKSTRLALMHGV